MVTAGMGEIWFLCNELSLMNTSSFFVNGDQYTSEMNVARQYAKQKQWPRAIFVRRARYYHTARLRWNCMERLRGPIEDSLIDDVVEWSMWHYAASKYLSEKNEFVYPDAPLSSQTVRSPFFITFVVLNFSQSQPIIARFNILRAFANDVVDLAFN